MKASFFIKYSDYRTGLRFQINGASFGIYHNQERMPDDEVFEGGFESLLAIQDRLKVLFSEMDTSRSKVEGEIWFTHLFQGLFHLSERVKRKYKRKKRKIK